MRNESGIYVTSTFSSLSVLYSGHFEIRTIVRREKQEIKIQMIIKDSLADDDDDGGGEGWVCGSFCLI